MIPLENAYMPNEINIYCDESCHLEHEKEQVMLVSCIYCPKEKVNYISNDLKLLKEKYNLWKYTELKWKKVSESKENYYIELTNYFLNNKDLHFRTVIIPHKEALNHEEYDQTHSAWYYKMIYLLVKYIPEYVYTKNFKFNVFIDKKENSYEARTELIKLKECLDTHFHSNFWVQNIVSDQSEILQLNDFIQGAVSYYNRGFTRKENCNSTKKKIVEILTKQLNLSLTQRNSNKKFNIFVWEGK